VFMGCCTPTHIDFGLFCHDSADCWTENFRPVQTGVFREKLGMPMSSGNDPVRVNVLGL